MSAASEPVQRQVPPSAARHSLFLPMLVLLFGSGIQVGYQIYHMEDQLDIATRTADQLEPTVKRTEYDRKKLFALSRELIILAPRDPAAATLVDQLHLRDIEDPANSAFTEGSVVPPVMPPHAQTGTGTSSAPK